MEAFHLLHLGIYMLFGWSTVSIPHSYVSPGTFMKILKKNLAKSANELFL